MRAGVLQPFGLKMGADGDLHGAKRGVVSKGPNEALASISPVSSKRMTENKPHPTCIIPPEFCGNNKILFFVKSGMDVIFLKRVWGMACSSVQ